MRMTHCGAVRGMKPVNAGSTGMIPSAVIRPMICLARLNCEASQLDGNGPPCFCRLPIRCLPIQKTSSTSDLLLLLHLPGEKGRTREVVIQLRLTEPHSQKYLRTQQSTPDTHVSSSRSAHLTEDVFHARGCIHKIDAIHRHPVDLFLPSTRKINGR